MVPYYGDFSEDATVLMPWHSFDAGGASVTAGGFVAADVAIYKDGGLTEKTTTNGVTVTTDFDSRTGLHLVTLDTSNDTGDAGFWVTGSDYLVAIDAVTVDSQSLRFWVGALSIENRAGSAGDFLDVANGVETGLTVREALRVIAAACAGKASGLATTTAVYRNAEADSKDRITATVDVSGNRSAVTLDLT